MKKKILRFLSYVFIGYGATLTVTMGVFALIVPFFNPDMTETRLLIEYCEYYISLLVGIVVYIFGQVMREMTRE